MRQFDGDWHRLAHDLWCQARSCQRIFEDVVDRQKRLCEHDVTVIVGLANILWETMSALGANPNGIDGFLVIGATDPRTSRCHLGGAIPFSDSTDIMPAGPHSAEISAIYTLWEQTYVLLFRLPLKTGDAQLLWYRGCLEAIVAATREHVFTARPLRFPAITEAPRL